MAPVEVDLDLRRLPASRLAMRLEGETDSRELPVYLTAAQAAARPAADRLHERRLGHAGRPALTASINDVEIGQITIAAAECRPACASTCRPDCCSPATTPSASAPGSAIASTARSPAPTSCGPSCSRHHRPRLPCRGQGLRDLRRHRRGQSGPDGAVHIRIRAAETRNPAMVARMLRTVEQAVLAAESRMPSSTSTRRRRRAGPRNRRRDAGRDRRARPAEGRADGRRRASRCSCRRAWTSCRAASPSW